MTSIYHRSVKNCTHFLIIVILLINNELHCAESKKERRRQARITALLTSYQNSKQTKPEDPAQKLLDIENAECERKENAYRLPLAPLACAGARQRERNRAYIQELRTATAPLPESVKQLIVDYARPEWFLANRFKIHEGRVSALEIKSMQLRARSCSRVKSEVAVWDTDTGAIITSDSGHVFYKQHIKQLAGFSAHMNDGYTDSHCSYDGQKLAATTVAGNNLYIWPSELPLAQAIATKKTLNIRSKKGDEQDADNPFMSVTFSPCSTYVFAGGIDGTMHQVDATTGESVYMFNHPALPLAMPGCVAPAVTALAKSDDGNTIYAGLQDGSVAVWKGDLLPPFTASSTIQVPADASDGPLPARMSDDAISIVQDNEYQHKVADFLCYQNCFTCCEHGKTCCSLCAQGGRVSAACCCNGASCLIQCPRTCVKGICYRGCAKQICAPFFGRIIASIRRLWQ